MLQGFLKVKRSTASVKKYHGVIRPCRYIPFHQTSSSVLVWLDYCLQCDVNHQVKTSDNVTMEEVAVLVQHSVHFPHRQNLIPTGCCQNLPS